MGKIIIIEGADGVGKTTLIKKLKTYALSVEKDAQKFSFYKEPQDSKCIYKAIMDFSSENCYRDFLLVFAARFDIWMDKVKKDLAEDKIVVLDRSVISTFAYQFFSIKKEDRDEKMIKLIHTLYEILVKAVKADVKFFVLNAPADVVCKRIDKREIEKDRFEKDIGKNIEVYNETIDYLNKQGWDIRKLDATQKPQKLLQEIVSNI